MNKILALLIVVLVSTTITGFSQKKTSKKKPSLATADSLYIARNYEAAIPVYQAVLKDKANEKNGQAWNRLGNSYHNLKDYPNAIKYYEVSEGILPVSPGLRVSMAKAYSASLMMDKAYVALDSALRAGWGNHKLLESDPEFENVRKDARFKKILDRIFVVAYPCINLPRAHDFDFWLGDWDVYLTANPSVKTGFNRITRASSQCVIVENWESAGAHNGMSINYYEPTLGKWQQKWAGSGQDIIEFSDGEYTDGAMRFKWSGTNPNGSRFIGRLTFTNIDPSKVRQHSESSSDEGKTWQTVYDFTYIKRN